MHQLAFVRESKIFHRSVIHGGTYPSPITSQQESSVCHYLYVPGIYLEVKYRLSNTSNLSPTLWTKNFPTQSIVFPSYAITRFIVIHQPLKRQYSLFIGRKYFDPKISHPETKSRSLLILAQPAEMFPLKHDIIWYAKNPFYSKLNLIYASTNNNDYKLPNNNIVLLFY